MHCYFFLFLNQKNAIKFSQWLYVTIQHEHCLETRHSNSKSNSRNVHFSMQEIEQSSSKIKGDPIEFNRSICAVVKTKAPSLTGVWFDCFWSISIAHGNDNSSLGEWRTLCIAWQRFLQYLDCQSFQLLFNNLRSIRDWCGIERETKNEKLKQMDKTQVSKVHRWFPQRWAGLHFRKLLEKIQFMNCTVVVLRRFSYKLYVDIKSVVKYPILMINCGSFFVYNRNFICWF